MTAIKSCYFSCLPMGNLVIIFTRIKFKSGQPETGPLKLLLRNVATDGGPCVAGIAGDSAGVREGGVGEKICSRQDLNPQQWNRNPPLYPV